MAALLIIGHGPSRFNVDDDFVDSHKVCRLRRCIVDVGKNTDIICSLKRYDRWPKGIEWWNFIHGGQLRKECARAFAGFHSGKTKPSTGLSACLIAKYKGYEDICVTGFDWVVHPETAGSMVHNPYAENECFKTLGITVYE